MRLMFVLKGEQVFFCLASPSKPDIYSFLISSPRPPSLAVSASDDCTARLWDARVRGEVGSFEDEYQITAVAYANDGHAVYTGGIDNCITAWDVRQMRKSMTMKGHSGRYYAHSLCTIFIDFFSATC